MKKEIKIEMKSIKHKNFQIQKQVLCPYCDGYQESVHFCTVKKCQINYDRHNKVIIEAETEAGAQRRGNVDDYGDCDITSYKNVMEMDFQCQMERKNEEKQKRRTAEGRC